VLIARQSTAKIVTVGPILDADGVAVTDSVIADLKLSKNGGAPAAFNGSATLTHRHTGYYSLSMTTSDADTVGSGEVTCDDTVNTMPMKEFVVVEEAVYDAMFAASALGYVANAPVNVAQWLGTNAATPTVAGVPEVDVTHWLGTAVATPTTAGVPEVDTTHLAGGDLSADGPIPLRGILDKGRAQSASATGLALRAGAAFADDAIIGSSTFAHGSTQGYWQAKEITDNALSGDTTTNDTWTVTPSGTVTYIVFGCPPPLTTLPTVNVTQISGDSTAADNAEAFFDGTGYAGTNNVIPTVTTVTGGATAAELAKVPKSDGTATWNATALASIQTEANNAIVANHLDHLLAATYDPASKPGASDALLNELIGNDGGVSQFTANSLELAPTGGSAPTVAQIRTEMDDNSTKLAAILAGTDSLDTTKLTTARAAALSDLIDGGRLDLLIDAVKAKTDLIPASPAAVGSAMVLSSAGLDAVLVESGISAGAGLTNDTGTQLTSINARQALSLFAAALDGVLAGAATTTITIKPAGKPAGNTRVTATVDASGNRSALTLKVPD
jgi:hypothetical protein